ncbi:hypothetical protein [Nonomuraea zeae]|uniref:Uncharacterized protein n=1 Tax=Nonomuraea zeae TaxID=1642303 RepID=A0A5S4FZZ8_9ACTN|nr:hypothetical protein [Nonomuraea zeae]TMR26278.1 hypothetical protein ETD85_43020 [Nonomuraea zeae]
MIADKRRPGKVVRRHFEICVFSCLADELVRGDVAAVGSEAYANWQSQLLSWEDCQPAHLGAVGGQVADAAWSGSESPAGSVPAVGP